MMKRDMTGLLVFLLLFGGVLLGSLYAYSQSTAILNVGLPAKVVNAFVAILSATGLGKTLYHIIRF